MPGKHAWWLQRVCEASKTLHCCYFPFFLPVQELFSVWQFHLLPFLLSLEAQSLDSPECFASQTVTLWDKMSGEFSLLWKCSLAEWTTGKIVGNISLCLYFPPLHVQWGREKDGRRESKRTRQKSCYDLCGWLYNKMRYEKSFLRSSFYCFGFFGSSLLVLSFKIG